MKGGTIGVIAFGSVCFLKRQLKAYQWLGAGIVILGIIVVGISGLAYGSNDSDITST